MFCTTVIATVARPKLVRAVESAIAQPLSAAEHQIIVVNDSDRPLPPADWQRSEKVQIVRTYQRERIVARNAGAALAQGRYLHFLDDDDWLLADGLERLRQLAAASPEAVWLYGGSQLVDRQGRALIELDHRLVGNCFVQLMAGEWVPLQSSLVNTNAFFAVGGFRHGALVGQDVDLGRRILLRGTLVGISEPVACIEMGMADSTTDHANGARYSRAARELILEQAGVLRRLLDSADEAQWHGRIVRIYLGSAIWNVQHGRGFTALSRLLFAAASLPPAKQALLSPRYWQAVAHAYQSETFARGAAHNRIE